MTSAVGPGLAVEPRVVGGFSNCVQGAEGLRARKMAQPRLLAIDDLQTVLTALKKVAEEMGYLVEATQHPQTFKNLTSSFEPDLILMDLVMAQEDGLELLRFLAFRKVSTPVILISDHGEELLSMVAKIGSALGLNIRAVQKPLGPSAWRDLLAPAQL